MEEAPSSQAPCKQSNSQRLPGVKEELPAGPPPDYRQHLYSLLGPGRAEYFLSPPALERCRTPGEQGLLEAVGGAGAEELWRVLHEDPQRQRQAAEARMGRAVAEQVRGSWAGAQLVPASGVAMGGSGLCPDSNPQRWSPLGGSAVGLPYVRIYPDMSGFWGLKSPSGRKSPKAKHVQENREGGVVGLGSRLEPLGPAVLGQGWCGTRA
ncbi:uncharacterized protein LOC128840022 isoform X4 [Malaclemys terrapin pileata]|nr:uncharacterized protein LOC128840022 isoform X4 [Malaclemys terrapin pileata]